MFFISVLKNDFERVENEMNDYFCGVMNGCELFLAYMNPLILNNDHTKRQKYLMMYFMNVWVRMNIIYVNDVRIDKKNKNQMVTIRTLNKVEE